VTKVERYPLTTTQTPYAFKRADVAEILHEVIVMKAQDCRGVMALVDEAPCLHPSPYRQARPEKDAYVMRAMGGDLDGWLRGKNSSQLRAPDADKKYECGLVVGNELLEALMCFHAGREGYNHGDLKADNVFYTTTDGNGCPTGIQLADFGHARKIGGHREQFENVWHGRSGHLPASLFEDAPYTPAVADPRRPRGYFTIDPLIDMCSFLYTMSNDFGIDYSNVVGAAMGGSHDCGMMGGSRRQRFQIVQQGR